MGMTEKQTDTDEEPYFRAEVRRIKTKRFGLFGPETWWRVSLGIMPVAECPRWEDAVTIANLAAVGANRRVFLARIAATPASGSTRAPLPGNGVG